MKVGAWIGAATLGVLGWFVGCGESGVVGGECRADWILCGERCVDPASDELHCGGCDNRCAPDNSCRDGRCSGESGGSAGEAGAGSGGSSGGGNSGGDGAGGNAGASGGVAGSSASGGSGATGAGGVSGGSGGDGGTGGEECLPPFDSPAGCGDCDTQCPQAAPLCAPVDDTFECVPACTPPLEACDDQCVDTSTHPLHCGRCFNLCPSGICVDSVCQGSMAGHVVYMCMNFEQSFQNFAQTTLLGNAVLLPNRDPVRVLAYGQHAQNAVMQSTDRTIRWAAAAPLAARQVEITRTNSVATVESDLTLADYDVFLVYDQVSAPAGELANIGSTLNATLDVFSRSGGVVIVLSSGTGTAEMPDFALSAGLADVTEDADYSYMTAHVRASGDALGLGVITPFIALPQSCIFTSNEPAGSNAVLVVTDTNPAMGVGSPLVLHKIVQP